MIKFLALIIVIAIFFVSFFNWRTAVKSVFFILVIEGALRKWLLPQASEMIYFLKDLVLLGAYIKYFLFLRNEKKIPITNNFINIIIFIVAGWCLVQALNPSLGSPLVGLLGLKAYLFYVPLIWILPTIFETEEDFYKFLRTQFLLIFLTGIIGILQFYSPVSSPINAYAGDTNVQVATFGFGASSAVRVSGTFSYINSYSGYLFVCFGLLVPMLTLRQTKLWLWLSIGEFFLIIINSVMNGSRTVTLASVLFLLGYIGIRGISQPSNTLRWLFKFSLPVIVVAIVIGICFAPAIDQFSRRTTKNQDISERISGSLSEPLKFIKYKDLDGYGAGATHPGTPTLRRGLGLPAGEIIPVGFEGEMGRIVLELGPIGFILWYGMRISIAIALLLVFWKLKRPFLRQLALAASLIQLIWLNGQLVFHHTFSVYFWFLTSFIFLLPRLEQMANWQQQLYWWQLHVQSAHLPDSPDGESELP
ncbi:hypothetical protein IQ264_02140 [Phormidium sp. LEGE 05292]|nr:hypothetical protein [Phormidium sp. LEGE 05292]